MKKLSVSLLVILLVLSCFSYNALTIKVQAEDYPAAERKILDAVLTACLEWGKWCAEHGYSDQILRTLAFASRIDKTDPKVTELEELTFSDGKQPAADSKPGFEWRLKTHGDKVSDLCIKAYRKKGKRTAERHRDYLAWAIESDPGNKTAWKYAADEIKAMQADKRNDDLGIFVPRILTIENAPDSARKPVLDAEQKTLTSSSLQRKATTHEMWYELALPRDWSPDKTWPVLFGFEGAGCSFAGYHKSFFTNRGSLPLIVVTLHTFSSTNELDPKKYKYAPDIIQKFDGKRIEFDFGGYEAVFSDLKRMYNAQDKAIVTGFSGGGNMTYFVTLHGPKELLASFPACPNFNPALSQGAEQVDDDTKELYIHIFTGADDPNKDLTHGKIKPGIEEQTDMAVKALVAVGFTKVQRTMLDGVGHSSCPKQVFAEISKLDFVRAEKR